jgi:exopolysaccharide biosynthesis polyprenyl glycosylphosphotransferase
MNNALNLRKALLFLGDIVLLYLSLFLTVFLGVWGKFSWQLFFEHLLPFSFLYFSWLIIFYIFGLYELNFTQTKINFYPRLLGGLLTGFVVGMVFFYLVPLFGITPKTNLILNILIFGVLILFWRRAFYFLFSRRLSSNLAILGKNQKQEFIAKEILDRPYLGYKLVAVFNDSRNLLPQLQEKKINTLILTEDVAMNFDLLQDLYRCLEARINFMDWTQFYEIICEKIPASLVNQAWFLENLREGEKGFYDKVKRNTDIIAAGILLVLTSPFWLLIALAIKIEDGGPVLYWQERIGKDRKPFKLCKFRSMKKDAEKNTGAVWAKKEDPRVTRVGKFLRRAHLDELPQMLNVFRGDISLVGPRPERPEFVTELEKKIPHYQVRHLIKPGFTGWAQLKFRYGRSVMDSQEKFQYDLYYLKNRNLFLDLGILLKTLQLIFKKE